MNLAISYCIATTTQLKFTTPVVAECYSPQSVDFLELLSIELI